MSSFDLWPFESVRSIERRGELEILVGTAPDGRPVTITRVAPDVARDAALRRRFKDAVDAATRHPGLDDPPILWADTSTLVPWAATYDDEMRRGADLIGGIFVSGAAGAGPAQPSAGPTEQPHTGEKSVPAIDVSDAPMTHRFDRQRYGYPGAYHEQQGVPPASYPAAPGAPGPPGGRRGSRTSLYIALGVAGLVAVLLLGTGISFGLTRERDPLGEPGSAPPSSSPVSSQSVQFSSGPATESPTPSATATTPKPKLKDRKPVSVYGPTWKEGEKTYTMNFAQLGWAFRAPGDFDCLVVKDTSAKTQVNCTKLGAGKNQARRVIIVDTQCSGTSCSAAERKKAETSLQGDRPKLKKKDKHTKYRAGTFTNEQNDKKYFGEYMGYYYKDAKGDLTRHVFVYADAPTGKYATQVQKTVNDIRTQAN